MGDLGDYWRDARAFRRAARTQWAECPSAGCQFGGNPVKVAPGENCRHCGWTAPGARGSDVAHARQDEQKRFAEEAAADADRTARREKLTCPKCGKKFPSTGAVAGHLAHFHSAEGKARRARNRQVSKQQRSAEP